MPPRAGEFGSSGLLVGSRAVYSREPAGPRPCGTISFVSLRASQASQMNQLSVNASNIFKRLCKAPKQMSRGQTSLRCPPSASSQKVEGCD